MQRVEDAPIKLGRVRWVTGRVILKTWKTLVAVCPASWLWKNVG